MKRLRWISIGLLLLHKAISQILDLAFMDKEIKMMSFEGLLRTRINKIKLFLPLKNLKESLFILRSLLTIMKKAERAFSCSQISMIFLPISRYSTPKSFKKKDSLKLVALQNCLLVISPGKWLKKILFLPALTSKFREVRKAQRLMLKIMKRITFCFTIELLKWTLLMKFKRFCCSSTSPKIKPKYHLQFH